MPSFWRGAGGEALSLFARLVFVLISSYQAHRAIRAIRDISVRLTSSSKAKNHIRVIRTISVRLPSTNRAELGSIHVLNVYPCSHRICPKNATGFVAQRSRLHWHLKQASLPNEASFIFSGYFLDMIISVGFRVNSYQDGSLQVVRKFRTVRKEGNRMVTRNMDYYNLDMIISVGFRVNSHQGGFLQVIGHS